MSTTRKSIPHTCVFGLGWGDEGKGKVVDLLSPAFDVVVRFNGGANAGHTVCVGKETFALHLLPTGALHRHATAVIGPGVVVDTAKLIAELDALESRGIDAAPRLKISDRAHLVLAYHKIEDQLSENAARSDGKIGTTARGIGPCYADKMRRSTAVRFADLVHDPQLPDRIREIVRERRTALQSAYGDDRELNVETTLAELEAARSRLASNVCDTTEFLHSAMDAGRRILFEGANGVLLDIDHGTYPFVTSSSTGPHGIGPGAGVPPNRVTCLVGTTKAYATRVGAGPFVTELNDDIGERIRREGKEYGTTTGRPRRCGWFDAVACRYAARVTGVTDLALMHVDTLSGLERVGICVAYRLHGRTLTAPPAHVDQLRAVEPIYEFLPGWNENLRSVRDVEELPAAARAYIERIESLVGVDAAIISVGPERGQTLVRGTLRETVKQDPTALAETR